MRDNMVRTLSYIAFLFLLISCKGNNAKNQQEELLYINNNLTEKNVTEKCNIGQKITGNFDGENPEGYAYIVLAKEGTGNPVADQNAIADEYVIRFGNKKIADLPIGCCDATLIFEGDLNRDGADEISVFQSPMNGCVYHWMTYTYKTGEWKELFDMFLIPTGCDGVFDDERLMNMVFVENGDVYHYERDVIDENLGWIKVKAVLK